VGVFVAGYPTNALCHKTRGVSEEARPKITTCLARSTASDRTSSVLSGYAKALAAYAKELPCRVRKFWKGLEEHGGPCGVPADELKLVKERHAWASWIGNFCGKSGDMRLPGEGFYKR